MKTRKRISAMLLAFMMVFSTVGYTPVAAAEHVHGTCGYKAEVPCGHTTHDDTCGYKEATEGSACNHEHDESCYRQVENCQHIHGDECYGAEVLDATPSDTPSPDNCTHECTVDSGCITEELDCSHVHDGECGYEAADDGQPCKHVQGEHDDTCGYEAGQPCIYQDSGTPDETISRQDAQKPLKQNFLTLGDTCTCVTQCVEQAPNTDCPVCGVDGANLEDCAVRGIGVQLRYYPQGLNEVGVPYDGYEGELFINVGASGVTVAASSYPATIQITPTSADGTATGPAVTYHRAGITTVSQSDPAASVYIPAYPSTGDENAKSVWRTAWADGLWVAYVPQEPEAACNCTVPCTVGTINSDCPVCKDATTETVANVCAVKVLPVSLTLFPGAVSAGGGVVYNDSTSRTVTVGASGKTTFTLDNATYPKTITIDADITEGPKKGIYQRAGFLLVDEQGAAQTAASVEVPAFPSTGDEAEKSAWDEKWSGGLRVAYVKQEAEPTSSLVPGETYWFDLSKEYIPGHVKPDNEYFYGSTVPDHSLHWVPFTFTGEITAYKVPDKDTSSDTASNSAYAHSLFIADYNVTYEVSWDDLNAQGLIFGKTYSAGNVDYTLRVPSVGSNSENGQGYGDGGTPTNNEWDQIPIEYIKNYQNLYSWGQDRLPTDTLYRASRGFNSARYYNYNSSGTRRPDLGFRPVLEILSPDTLTSDGLRVVTVDLKGGSIGGFGQVNLVVAAGEANTFKAPSNVGITLPTYAERFLGWRGDNGDYQPGEDIGSGENTLTATWKVKPSGAVNTDGDDDDDSGNTGNPVSQPGTTIPIISGDTSGTVTVTGGTNTNVTSIPEDKQKELVEGLQNSGVMENLMNHYLKGQTKPGESGKYLVPGTEIVKPIFGAEITTQIGTNGVVIQMEAATDPAATGMYTAVDAAVDAASKITKNSTQADIIAALGQLEKLLSSPFNDSPENGKKLYDAANAISITITGGSIPLSDLPGGGYDYIGTNLDIKALIKKISNGNASGMGNNYTVETGYALVHIQNDGVVEGYIGTPSAGTLEKDVNGNTPTTVSLMKVSTNGTTKSNSGFMTITETPNGTKYKFLVEGVTSTSPFILCRIHYLALSNPFIDVAGTDWFYPAVMELYSRGIMQGTSATTFSPQGIVTRAQAAQVLYNMDGRPQAAPGGVTSDIPADAWYADAAAWAMGRGIVQVTGDRFGGDDPVSRQELVEMLYRYAKYRGWDVSMGENTNILSYKDFDQISEAAVAAFQWACGAGIVQSDENGYLHTQDGLTRAELAQMLQRTLEKYKQPAAPVSPNTGTSKSQRHKVQKGDTLSRLAGKYKTTVAAIVRANPIITDPSFLRVGWELEIPQN